MLKPYWRMLYSPDAGTEGSGGDPAPATEDPKEGTNSEPNKPSGKTYSQDDINRMLANEKRTARQALFRELGLEYDDKSYKTSLENAKKTLDAGKTQAQLDAEARKQAESGLAEEQKKTAALEAKFAALSAGVKPEFLDDIISLALPKVDDKTDLEAVLKTLKEKYPGSFTDDKGSSGNGTGNPTNPARKSNNDQDTLGKRLASGIRRPPEKSNFFKN